MTNLDRERALTRCGIDESYIDCFGNHVAIPKEIREKLFAAMLGEAVDSFEQIVHRRTEHNRQLPLLIKARISEQVGFVVTAMTEDVLARATWHATLENGEQEQGSVNARALDGAADSSQMSVDLLDSEALPAGIHQLILKFDGYSSDNAWLVVAPGQSFVQPILTGEEPDKVFGLVLQLYGLRSSRNWGIGDFTDLKNFAVNAAKHGVDTVGINPIHALFPANPKAFTPYSPSHRAFFNVLYIDPEVIDEFQNSKAATELIASPAFKNRLAMCRQTAGVDYVAVSDCKFQVFEILYDEFLSQSGARSDAYQRFLQSRGEALYRHALYEVLYEYFFRLDSEKCGWREWPASFQDPESPGVKQFAEQNQRRIGFYMYLQWQAELQLAALQREALAAGMKIGLYLDMAVGVDGGGSETWSNQGVFCFGASVGAPPDPLALEGQDWGFPPFDPYYLRDAAYAPMLENLRANMKYAGAIRIDHAVSMLRLWWVPQRYGAKQGGYVRYKLDEIVALIALESHRQECLVIGEDLGTVPPELPGVMDRNSLYGYRVLYFEMEGDRLVPPEHYPKKSLATINTHDLAPLKSWWDASDIQLRESLGVISDSSVVDQLKSEREHHKQLVLNALHHYGWMDDYTTVNAAPQLTPAINDGLHAYLSACASSLVVSQIEDWMDVTDPFNVPGTLDEYPNWQLKYPQEIDRFFDDRERVERLAMMQRVRRG